MTTDDKDTKKQDPQPPTKKPLTPGGGPEGPGGPRPGDPPRPRDGEGQPIGVPVGPGKEGGG